MPFKCCDARLIYLCCASYQKTKNRSSSNTKRASPPDGTMTQPGMNRSFLDLPAARHTTSSVELAMESHDGYETSSYGSATTSCKRSKTGQSSQLRRSLCKELLLFKGSCTTQWLPHLAVIMCLRAFRLALVA